MDINKYVTQAKQDNAENVNQEDVQNTHIRGKHALDPKVVQKLEMEILKSMSNNSGGDSRFGTVLPDASLTTATTSVLATSIFNSSTTFTMESFTENTLSSLAPPSSIQDNDMPMQKELKPAPCSCCFAPIVRPDMQAQRKLPPDGSLLPDQASEDRGKICLVLDLDETLVHSSFLAIPHADYRFNIGVDSNPVAVFVCVRPGAEKFLRELGQLYELVIFTASCQVYADPVIDFIDKGRVVKYRLYREACTDFNGSFVKDLSRLNRSLDKVMIIDNSSVAYLLQPYNAMPISSWFDDPTDNELFIILEKLKHHHRAKNINTILYPE